MKKITTLAAGLGLAAVLAVATAIPANASTVTGTIPSTGEQGATVTLTATVTAEAAGARNILVQSAGSGTVPVTLSAVTTPSVTCTPQGATGADSGLTCAWSPSTAGETLVLTVSIGVPAGAAVGDTYDLGVLTQGTDPGLPLEGTLTVTAAQVTPVDPALPTAIPAGTAQVVTGAPLWMIGAGSLFALFAVVGVSTFVIARGRARS